MIRFERATDLPARCSSCFERCEEGSSTAKISLSLDGSIWTSMILCPSCIRVLSTMAARAVKTLDEEKR